MIASINIQRRKLMKEDFVLNELLFQTTLQCQQDCLNYEKDQLFLWNKEEKLTLNINPSLQNVVKWSDTL